MAVFFPAHGQLEASFAYGGKFGLTQAMNSQVELPRLMLYMLCQILAQKPYSASIFMHHGRSCCLSLAISSGENYKNDTLNGLQFEFDEGILVLEPFMVVLHGEKGHFEDGFLKGSMLDTHYNQ